MIDGLIYDPRKFKYQIRFPNMQLILLLRKIKRVFKKPPNVIIYLILKEFQKKTDRIFFSSRYCITDKRLLEIFNSASIDSLWMYLSKRPYFSNINFESSLFIDSNYKNEIVKLAQQAMSYNIDILGSGIRYLGPSVNWSKDQKTNFTWPNNYFSDIEYNNLDYPSDVKYPWELSRLQWVIPVGQAFLLTKDDKYSRFAKQVVLDWIHNNKCGYSVNWSCTMEAAIRIYTFTWLFHVFKESSTWIDDENFKSLFLKNIYYHCDFTQRYIERSDINGNHYTADASALCIGGSFWGDNVFGSKISKTGWNILTKEIFIQVYEDGVDFEGSVPYHRLVTELFLYPAIYRLKIGQNVDKMYLKKLMQMAEFSIAYCKPNNLCPTIGDADDARTLPFGHQEINDHSYLSTITGILTKSTYLINNSHASRMETFWIYGTKGLEYIDKHYQKLPACSAAFESSGYYVMKNDSDYVFIDCAEIGLSGRGGHGHNDCLSFELSLQGQSIIIDPGSPAYTGNYHLRNKYRSTLSHNTPMVDDVEMNSFIHPKYLWNLSYEAKPKVNQWIESVDSIFFSGSHNGYQKLADPVTIIRSLMLSKPFHSVSIYDEIKAESSHFLSIPLHFHPDVNILDIKASSFTIECNDCSFVVEWISDCSFILDITKYQSSPSYGILVDAFKAEWTANINKSSYLFINIKPLSVKVQMYDQFTAIKSLLLSGHKKCVL